MGEWDMYPREAVAVGMKAIEQGVARLKFSPDELFKNAERIIRHAREEIHKLQETGFIQMPPVE